MDGKLAFVLGGGGARGALQVGALYALLESGLQPDLLVGTSIGAVNAAFLALHGFSRSSLDRLAASWRSAASLDLLPANYVWLTLRAMLGRSSPDPSHRIRDFFIANGVTPELTFADIQGVGLVIVSADISAGQPVLHGDQPADNLLEALLLSTALPPWTLPVKKQGRYLMDGGLVSNLPIEPALRAGAAGIVALDLMDSREIFGAAEGVMGFIDSMLFAVEKRQTELELELAAARGVPLIYLGLSGSRHVPLWDFSCSAELIAQGYEIAREALCAPPASDLLHALRELG